MSAEASAPPWRAFVKRDQYALFDIARKFGLSSAQAWLLDVLVQRRRDKRAAKRATQAPANPAPAQPSLEKQMTEVPVAMPGLPKAEA